MEGDESAPCAGDHSTVVNLSRYAGATDAVAMGPELTGGTWRHRRGSGLLASLTEGNASVGDGDHPTALLYMPVTRWP